MARKSSALANFRHQEGSERIPNATALPPVEAWVRGIQQPSLTSTFIEESNSGLTAPSSFSPYPSPTPQQSFASNDARLAYVSRCSTL